jgi:PDZ domain-containing protein
MITMEILNKIGAINMPEDVLIAGTGTISSDGTIGSIGGINQKIVTAFRKGIDVYFMPKNNVDDITIDLDKYKDMKIIYVENIEDIIDYINELKNNPKISGLFFNFYWINEVLSIKICGS